jgi:hypothetical protein
MAAPETAHHIIAGYRALLEENLGGLDILAIHRPFSSSYLARLHFDQAVLVHGRLIHNAEKGDTLSAADGDVVNLVGKERPHFPNFQRQERLVVDLLAAIKAKARLWGAAGAKHLFALLPPGVII